MHNAYNNRMLNPQVEQICLVSSAGGGSAPTLALPLAMPMRAGMLKCRFLTFALRNTYYLELARLVPGKDFQTYIHNIMVMTVGYAFV